MNPQALKEIFLNESEELVNELEQSLVALEGDPTDEEAIHQLFRSAHTLKGSAGMVGYDAIVRLAHVAESVLSRVREHDLAIDASLISALLRSVDDFRSMLSDVGESIDVVESAHALETKTLLQSYVLHVRPPAAPKPVLQTPSLRIFRIEMSFSPTLFTTGQDPAFFIADLAEVGDVLAVEAKLEAIPSLAELDPEQCYLGWQVLVRTDRALSDIKGVFVFLDASNRIEISDVTRSNSHIDGLADARLGELLIDEGCVREEVVVNALKYQKRIGEVLVELGAVPVNTVKRALEKQRAARHIRRNTSIRVDTEKLDKLVNLVGELAVTISQVNQTVRNPQSTVAKRIAITETLEVIGKELQSQVMSVRMVPIEETFSRFKRVARDLAQELGKQVVLDTLGNETEIDKNVAEQLADPLKHMVRNAIAHGLESPEVRIASGKSDTGHIELRAAQRQGQVIIEVSDDGRGIDPERIYAKARERGLISSEDRPSEREILELLFRPGFSTAEEVDEVAGRGVGLDVVKRNVGELHGQIEIDSQLGRGTTFRIRLPITLAIIEGMNVRVGRDTMTIPLTSVIELLAPTASSLSTIAGKGELVNVRGEHLPIVRLNDVLDCIDPQASSTDPTIVVVESSGRRFGIYVDRVLGMEQAVVKPLRQTFGIVKSLDRSYRRLDAVSGATILGDGNIALILDVPGIERLAFGGIQ